jgi:hypothetical protein
MNITFYPSLGQSLNRLKKGEVLYTNSWFILNPIRILYKENNWKEFYGDKFQYIPSVIYEEKLTVSNKLKLEGKKKPDSKGLDQERGLYFIESGKKEKIVKDIKDLYKYYFFRKEEIEELIEDLISSSEKNKGVFKEPLRKAITLGLGEVKEAIKSKDFIAVGVMPGHAFGKARGLGALDHVMEHLRNPVIESLENEGWKKEFSETFGEFLKTTYYHLEREVKEIIIEKINYVNEIEKKGYGLYRREKAYFWHNVIEVVDRGLGPGGGRITADVWEKGGVLGLEFGEIGKLEDLIHEDKKKTGKSAEEVSPEVLGSISLYLPTMPKPEKAEVVLVPSGIRNKNKNGDKEIDLLVLVKLEVKDKEFSWSHLYTQETKGSISIRVTPQHSIKIISKEEVPKNLMSGKGKILVKPRYSESIEILNMHVSLKRGVETGLKSMKKQALLKRVHYLAETDGLNKSIVVNVDDKSLQSILIKDYDEIKDGKSIGEKITIETFLRKNITPNMEKEKEVKGCLGGDEVDKIIKEELEQLAIEIKEYAETETRKEEKTALESASLVAKRTSEVFERGNISLSKCEEAYKSESYRYTIYTKPVKGYRPIIEDKELVETLKKCCNTMTIRKYEILFNLYDSKVEELCFDSNGVKAKVKVGEMDKIIGDGGKKEVVYLKNLSKELSNMFSNYVNEIISRKPHPGYDLGREGVEYLAKIPDTESEVKEINELSLLLSGAIASSMLIPWEKFPLMGGKREEEMIKMVGKLYKAILIVLTGGGYEYVDKREKEPWSNKEEIFWIRKRGTRSMLNEKELLREMIGATIRVKVSEKIEVFISGYGGKGRYRLKRAGFKTTYDIELPKYEEKSVTFYLKAGRDDKVVKMEAY